MESTDSSAGAGPGPNPNLPPGFRFHPTDEELVIHYLKKKASSSPLPVAIIAEVDLYKFDPWELPAKATFGEHEWYFFSPRDRKYPNGARPNRAATSGYWKATGTDKPVLTSGGTLKVGVKKALVFYGGKPPKGIKTNWIMHEYRLADNKPSNKPPSCVLGNKKNSLRLDDWVLCRIYQKSNTQRHSGHELDDSVDDMFGPILPSMAVAGNEPAYVGFLENGQSMYDGAMYTSASKRGLPSLQWMEEPDQSGASPSKRVQLENDERGGHFATLLSQTPQFLLQQGVHGSIGSHEGGLKQGYPLPGFNRFT